MPPDLSDSIGKALRFEPPGQFLEIAPKKVTLQTTSTDGQSMNNIDVRWQQRFHNFGKALQQLDEAMELMQQRSLSKLEKQGVIQGFEYCYELGWNTLKDFLIWQGIDGIVGSRDTIREAFSKGLVSDGHGWMQMLTDRNRTSHTYNEETAEAILTNIQMQHHPLLKALENTLAKRVEPKT